MELDKHISPSSSDNFNTLPLDSCNKPNSDLEQPNSSLVSVGASTETAAEGDQVVDQPPKEGTNSSSQIDLKTIDGCNNNTNEPPVGGIKRVNESPCCSDVDSEQSIEDLKLRQPFKLSSVLVQPEHRRSGEALEQERKAVLELQKNDKQVLDRNKRMFGMLMGTLQRFKTEESGRERLTNKRSRIEQKLDSAEEKERTLLVNEKVVNSKQEQETLLERANAKLDTVDRFKNWERTNKHLSGFIRTETKPRLLWLPKEHNSITEKKLKETRDYFGLCMAERTAKFKKELDELNDDNN